MVNYKKFITLLLIFSVYMMPFNTQAAGFGAWTITNSVAQGASTILTGSKEVILNGAKKIATGTAKITPTASQVAKVLARGAAGYALSVAVEQLIGAVDWVLDPANNQIRYTEEATREIINQVSCELKAKQQNKKGVITAKTSVSGGVTYVSCYADGKYWDAFKEGALDSQVEIEKEEKTLPLDVVAQQVISNAESGDTNAQVATSAAAADIINEAENDNVKARPIVQQLENTQSIPTDQTAQGESVPKESENTGDPTAEPVPQDITLDFPIFCDWAPSVCQAAKEVIKLPITLTDWWSTATSSISESWTWAKSRYEAAVTSISEFFQEETNTDTELEFNDPTDDITDTTISFSDQCPAPITLADFNYHGIQQKWEMDFTGWCDVLTTYFKPIVIAMAGFSAVLIVSGVRENG